ncbi:hypothetical protein P154DRAFT_537829 [Amniculicola lignicola CBS 123094]|uniref:Uncharacterized protein n=1 Tax=Amniculicola lignicola CBS 123094 TaxID=1392246 RepID=A0A6A5W5M6_9PLEO|nr:hypothetical protein P154DRAFT_537829 [Amniculicola lignicola CBS 123094]
MFPLHIDRTTEGVVPSRSKTKSGAKRGDFDVRGGQARTGVEKKRSAVESLEERSTWEEKLYGVVRAVENLHEEVKGLQPDMRFAQRHVFNSSSLPSQATFYTLHNSPLWDHIDIISLELGMCIPTFDIYRSDPPKRKKRKPSPVPQPQPQIYQPQNMPGNQAQGGRQHHGPRIPQHATPAQGHHPSPGHGHGHRGGHQVVRDNQATVREPQTVSRVKYEQMRSERDRIQFELSDLKAKKSRWVEALRQIQLNYKGRDEETRNSVRDLRKKMEF